MSDEDRLRMNDVPEQLEGLPLLAIVAFAARCARRVRCLVESEGGDNGPPWTGMAVDLAIQLAEAFAGGKPIRSRDLRAVAETAHEAARTFERKDVRNAAVAASEAAHAAAAAYAGRESEGMVIEAAKGAAGAAGRAAQAASGAARYALGGSEGWLDETARSEAAQLRRLSLGSFPDLGESVDPTETGPLGQLWLEKAPEWHVVAEREPEQLRDMRSEDPLPLVLQLQVERLNDELVQLATNTSRLLSDSDAIRKLQAECRKLADDQERALQSVNTAIDDVSRLQQQNASWLEQSREEIKALQSDSELRLKGLEESLTAKIVTEQPVKYWSKRSGYHRRQFFIWGAALAVTGIGCVTLVGVVWSMLFGSEEALSPWRVGFALLTGTIVLLLLRVLTRMVLSHLHLASESQERVVMMQAYIALALEGRLDESHRSLILQALFRPSTTGLVKEDAVPASVLDLASRVTFPPGGGPKS